jgi:hypothetical protein
VAAAVPSTEEVVYPGFSERLRNVSAAIRRSGGR